MVPSKLWQVPKMWEGEDVWIIGGGPSIIDSFGIPTDLVKAVRLREKEIEAYSPYFAAIHAKHVIGINVAYKFGNWVDICFFGDKSFFLNHQAGLSHFKKLVVTCSSYIGQKNLGWVKYLSHETKRNVTKGQQGYGISTNARQVCWNKNSGAAAISVAAWLGVKRIILVGFDMTISPVNNEQHFHNEYRQFGMKLKTAKLPFKVHLQPWGVIKSDADNMGIELLNTSLNSAIKEIPKVHMKELL